MGYPREETICIPFAECPGYDINVLEMVSSLQNSYLLADVAPIAFELGIVVDLSSPFVYMARMSSVRLS
jgi:hypothetical protein